MASSDLSAFKMGIKPNGESLRIVVIVASWNQHITSNLLQGCIEALEELNVNKENILIEYVPGSFELPLGAKWMIQKYRPDAAICLGCVIKGETYHFELVSDTCARGIMQVSLDSDIPVVMGVLSDYSEQQSIDRSGGCKGNKGVEAAYTAVQMAVIAKNYRLSS